MDELKKTPLYDEHVKMGAKIVEYAGFLMPLEYSSIAKEHVAVRTKAGIFDVSHMGEVMIKGRDATRFMEKLYTNDVVNCNNFKVTYGFMLYEDGGIIDDMLVYKYNEEQYFIVFNASNAQKDYDHMLKVAEGFKIEIEDLRVSCAEVAIQGPMAYEILQSIVDADLNDIKFFEFKEVKINNETCIVSRTGYTGEDGFEVYASNENIHYIWEKLLASKELTPCGLGCRDTLRFEASLPLYGQEIDKDITPLEAGLGFGVKFTHDFIGKEALLKQKEQGLTRISVGLELLDRGIPRHGYKVFKDGKEIGYITTGYNSPTVNKPIAMALINKEESAIGNEVYVEIRNKLLKAVIRDKKFYTKMYVR
jgi:aminomethyltransferase